MNRQEEVQTSADQNKQQVQADTGQPQENTANEGETSEKQPDQKVDEQNKEGEQPAEGEKKEEPQGDVCKVEILKAYGLQGLVKPSTQQLLMFPRISQTCCRQTDQMKIFDQWLRHHQKTKIKTKIEHIENHYKELIELLTKLEGIVLGVKKKLSHKNIANCKELANRILSFEISDLGPQILSNIHQMNKFMFEAFTGFYHTLCDFNNHKFFNLEKKEILYSKKFCRKISKNTLSTLIFFYKDINYYLNLIAKFMTTCDASGNYTPSVLPDNLTFSSDPLIEEVLLECKHDRNSKNWFQKCIPICENFTITRYAKFFEPQYDKITHLFNFLKVSIEKFESSSGKSLFTNVMPPQENLLGRRRLLSEASKPAEQDKQPTNEQNTAQEKTKAEGKEGEKKQEGQEKKEGEKKEGDKKEEGNKKPKVDDKNKVFEQEPGYELDLGSFIAVFQDDGIALRENGVNTLVSKEIYNEIMIIHHDELKALDTDEALEVIDISSEGAEVVTPQQNAVGGNTKSLAIFINIFILFLIQLFNFNHLKFLNQVQ